MKELPLISVIVPVYKVEPYLDKCIRSIVEQTYQNLEIILVDDGSPDRSGEICDEWAAKDCRIRVIHKENGGSGAARNSGLEIARGDLIGIVDSDDYIAPQMYEHLYSLMDGEVDIAECGIVETELDDQRLDDGSQFHASVYSVDEAMLLHIRDERFRQTPPNKLYRSSAVGDSRFPVGTLIDDEFWTYRVIGNARKLAQTSCCMYAYRQQESSAMHRPYSVRRLDGLKAKLERWEYLKVNFPSLAPEAQKDLLMSCLYGAQGSLDALRGNEQQQAWAILKETMERITPVPLTGEISVKRKLLMYFAQKSLKKTANIMNFLLKVHILT